MQPIPKPIQGMNDVTYISAGTWHSAAITSDNQVYVWGDGKKGQLGTGKKNNELSPVNVADPLSDARVMQVACGGGVTAFLTSEGRVYQAGNGHMTSGSSVPFQARGDMEGVQVDEVACGHAHVVAVGIYRRRLFTWGVGSGGRLGHGDERSESKPRKLIRTLPGRVVTQVTCGPASTAVVLAPGRADPAEPEQMHTSESTAAEAMTEGLGRKCRAAASKQISRMSRGELVGGESSPKGRSARQSGVELPLHPPQLRR